ncbi:MAG TPA: hypothetical protein VFY91_14985 [Microbacterium sp.]|nr:hypothetical protein [Microbacterium sp.]
MDPVVATLVILVLAVAQRAGDAGGELHEVDLIVLSHGKGVT